MRMYLVQHGEAVSREENLDRPLSEKSEPVHSFLF